MNCNAGISRRRSALALCGLAAGIVIGAGAFRAVPAGGASSQKKIRVAKQAPASDRTLGDYESELRKVASQAENLASAGKVGTAADFLDALVRLHKDDRDFILGTLHGNYDGNPDQMHPFVKEVALLSFERDRESGLDFIAGFPREQGILNIERHLMTKWVRKDAPGLLALYQARASGPSRSGSEPQLLQLAAIYAEEGEPEFGELVKWARGMTGEPERDIQWGAYEAIARQAPAGERESVLRELMEKVPSEPRFQSLPSILIGNHAREAPEEAARLLDSLEDGQWKIIALSQFLSNTALHHPQAGMDLLNRESFIAEFLPSVPPESGEEDHVTREHEAEQSRAEAFYDEALNYFLEAALAKDPQIVLDSANAFYNPEKRELFRKAAKRALGL